ncbi:polyprenyl synthetase family protein [Amycolatopsis magusensis]|uniref:polyprenyl synthetase family protein n=1 Tax=Amycolatopsis magusensis TaxID=882444 RepID=UPI0024A92EC3|nr:polyprenyl synthetase family protein [Amycolatopsis magusensis]MDI5980079.1 polyprenyl synthetase family protein [Amycolatopsis magusensis]
MSAEQLVHAFPRPRRPPVDAGWVRAETDRVLADFLREQAERASDRCLPTLVAVITDFLDGGKRLRPIFCHWGWVAGGGAPGASAVLHAGAGLELFHTFALIHDDVMDCSALRRGKPTVHEVLATRFRDDTDAEAAHRFGMNAAILLGDLCLAWADDLLQSVAAERGRSPRVQPLLHEMRTEVMVGQYLDLGGEHTDSPLDRSWRAIGCKTAGYTVEKPLQLGAALAGADEDLLSWCSAYGRPLGEAFQLRDDLLGAFGDVAVTGKPALDDFRDGKQTVLMGLTWERATPRQREVIRRRHGDPHLDEEGADELRTVIRETGAEASVRRLINDRAAEASLLLARPDLPDAAAEALAGLVGQVTRRTR